MTCRELVDLLDRHLGDELSSDERAGLDAHLSRCPSCARYLRAYLVTRDVARGAWDADDLLRGDLPEELVNAIVTAASRRRHSRRRPLKSGRPARIQRGVRRQPCTRSMHRVVDSVAPPRSPAEDLLVRVRAEFSESPGLQLTSTEAARLLGLKPGISSMVLEQLAAEGFLRRNPRGRYVRRTR